MPRTQPIAPEASLASDPLIGQKLGDYQVERFIAQGGMGMVYAAVHPLLKRRAAVKVLRPELVRDHEQEERFLKEAQAISAIRHRGIIDVYTFGRLQDGRYYMLMEFLEGRTLEALLHEEGPLPPNRALPIIDEILDALSAAHKVGVVHRDLKPANVFMAMQSNGTAYAKLVDFGLAKQSIGGASNKASVIAGTPEYISPEQARGGEVSAQTDLYCLGVMLFEMISGGLPFAGSNLIEFLRAHLEQQPPKLSSYTPVPEQLDELVDSLLAKRAEDRPHSADAVRRTIAQILRETRDASTLQVPRERVSKPAAPPTQELGDDDYPLEDTQVRGSDPMIQAMREKATGPRPTQVARRSSGSNLGKPPRPSRPSQPGLKRPSSPNLKRPSKSDNVPLPPAADDGDGEHQTLAPGGSGSRPLGEGVITDPPMAPVLPDQLTRTNATTASKPWLAIAGAVALVGALGGGYFALRDPPDQPLKTEVVGLDLQPPVKEKKPEPAPAPVAPKVDPELEAKLKDAAQKDQEASKKSRDNGFLQNLQKTTMASGEKMDTPDKVAGYQRALAKEVAEDRLKKREQEEKMTPEERSRAEVREAKEMKDRDARNKALCQPGWDKQTKKRIGQIKQEKLAALDPDDGSFLRRKAEVDKDAADLIFMLSSPGTLICADILAIVDGWEKSKR